MKKLTDIGIKTGTDKATFHLFTDVYDSYFCKYKSPRILEIGILNAASIKMYQEYFQRPYIVGMDYEDKSHLQDGTWKFVRGDQSNPLDLMKCVRGEELFDIILDDGGHTMKQQQVSFGTLINFVSPGGVYIIEDLHTSTSPTYIDSDCEFTSLTMMSLLQQRKSRFSNYINEEQQQRILSKISGVHVFSNRNLDNTCSITGIIEVAK